MDLSDVFKKAVKKLRAQNARYGICGGIAASLYRSEQRFTRDVDIMLGAGRDSVALATEIISSVGLKPNPVRLAQLSPAPAMNKKRSPVAVIVGRAPGKAETEPGLDFLLQAVPWVGQAIDRAQANERDFGFGPVPCITVEDLIVAKAVVKGGIDRGGRDLDDLVSIFKANVTLDIPYLAAEFDRHRIVLPRELNKLVPKALAVACRRMRGQKRER